MLLRGKCAGVEVYGAFLSGAKKGMEAAWQLLPALTGMLLMLSLMNASGLTALLVRLLSPLTAILNLPQEVAPMLILRPMTGSGSLAALQEIFAQYGADSRVGRIASVLMGSSETIFYTMSVYLGAAGVKKLPGALGVSLGLGYAPECFYTTRELIRALEPLAGQNIPLTVHMRQEGGGVCQSVEEMLLVARELRIPLHISHLKAMGRDNWGKKIPQALSMLQRAKDEGMDVGCDVYPYTAGSTQLLHILPPEFLEGGMDAVVRRLADPAQRQTLAHRIEDGDGFDDIAKLAGWDGIFLSSLHCPEDEQFLGKSIAEEAAMEHKSPLDSCCDLLIREHCQVTMIDFMAAEEDIAAILRSPLSCLISDATYPTEGMPHPRVYGSCTRLLQHFVGEKGVLSLEEGVRKLTLEPARALRLPGKGVIAVGADADLCVFDPAALSERGTYQQPCRTAEGMTAVFVGGQLAVENGRPTGVKNGRIIRR